MIAKILSLKQPELANILCLLLTTVGVTLGVLSLFEIPYMNREETKELGAKAFGVGVTLGFGVSGSPVSGRKERTGEVVRKEGERN